jgi:hypothetical protein
MMALNQSHLAALSQTVERMGELGERCDEAARETQRRVIEVSEPLAVAVGNLKERLLR